MVDQVEVDCCPSTTLVTFIFPTDGVDDIELSLPTVPRRGELVRVRGVGSFAVRDLTWVLESLNVTGKWLFRARIDLERVFI